MQRHERYKNTQNKFLEIKNTSDNINRLAKASVNSKTVIMTKTEKDF